MDRTGVDLVPLQGSKHLIKNYGSHSLHVVDAADAHTWVSKQANNLGVMLGGAFGLIVADFDDVGVYDGWRDGPGSTVETLTEKSARGYHVFFQGHDVPSGHAPGIELKTGGVVMVAPSMRPSVDDEAGLWGCYSSGCPVNAQGIAAHDVINLRMWAQGISVQAAIRQLATEFLPPLPSAPRKPPPHT